MHQNTVRLIAMMALLFSSSWAQTMEFGIVCDAGSSGTRAYIFTWASRTSPNATAPISRPTELTKNSGFARIDSLQNQAQADTFIQSIVDWAKNTTQLANQTSRWGMFPIYIKATAGARGLPTGTRQMVMNWIRVSLNKPTINPFFFTDNNAVITAGEEEAVNAWLAVNYLIGSLGKSGDQTFGILELGGASTQVAFAYQPSSDILNHYQGVNIFGANYRLYALSYLEYGGDAIEMRVAEALAAQPTTMNPCLNAGYDRNYTIGGSIVTQSGTSNYTACLALIQPLLLLNEPCLYQNNECGIGSEYMPAVNTSTTFYALSAFVFTLNTLVGAPTSIDIAQIAVLAQDICSRDWANMTASWPTDSFRRIWCLQLTYITTLLRDGYKFPPTNTNIEFVLSINGSGAEWVQGSILKDVNAMPFTTEPVRCSNTSSVSRVSVGWVFVGMVASLGVGVTLL